MQAIDLTKKLKGYNSGWVALDINHEIVDHADTFESLSKKLKNKKSDIILMPASSNYFGFVSCNG